MNPAEARMLSSLAGSISTHNYAKHHATTIGQGGTNFAGPHFQKMLE